jgi:predicted alpha/beta-fold hydrolase
MIYLVYDSLINNLVGKLFINYHKEILIKDNSARNINQLWNWFSPNDIISNIQTTMLLCEDDPMITSKEINKQLNENDLNENINIIRIKSGGHCSGIENTNNLMSDLDIHLTKLIFNSHLKLSI